MERAKGIVIGAVGTLLVLVVALAVLWWVVTVPAGETDAGPDRPPVPGDGPPPALDPPPALGRDEVWLADLRLGTSRLVAADASLRDVRAVGRGVVTRPGGLVAARVDVRATVPFGVVAAELGEGTTVRAAAGGQAEVVRSVEVLGRALRVVARGTVEVERGRLVVEPRSIDLGGPDLVAEGIAAVVRELVTVEHEVDGLPDGLVLEDVVVRDDGFRASLRGRDVELVP